MGTFTRYFETRQAKHDAAVPAGYRTPAGRRLVRVVDLSIAAVGACILAGMTAVGLGWLPPLFVGGVLITGLAAAGVGVAAAHRLTALTPTPPEADAPPDPT